MNKYPGFQAKAPFLAFLMLSFCVLAGWCRPAAAQDGGSPSAPETPDYYVVLSQGASKKYVIAVTDLQPISPGGRTGEPAVALPARLRDNLDMTGLFIPLDKRTFVESNPRAGLDPGLPVEFGAWSSVGAEFLVKGGLNLSGSALTLEMRLYDVVTGRMMLGKRYVGKLSEGRQMINRFTNDLLEAITGEPGVFGSKIAFVSGSKAGKQVMMTELGSDEATVVAASKNGPSTQPTVGPGNRVAWIHRNGKNWQLLQDGKVVSSGQLHLSPAFMPNGSLAAAFSGPSSTDIYVFSGSSKQVLAQGGGINISPTFSPDGSMMAFVSNRAGGAQIYVAPVSGGAPRRLTTVGGKNTDPSWSPKGDKIVFVTRESDICIINADGSGFAQLTSGQGINMRPSFSPDGRMITFSSTRGGRPQIYIMSANGDRQQPLMPSYAGDQQQPFWSPERPQ